MLKKIKNADGTFKGLFGTVKDFTEAGILKTDQKPSIYLIVDANGKVKEATRTDIEKYAR